ncbi:MAG TPA: DUF1501 domain-containing protein [Limnobacter sp.]|uniref:DUF1501 domain-containing protein n=1 Tax=Limnobacter sp. TaxID=2003368 RepID=UPI002ED8AA11
MSRRAFLKTVVGGAAGLGLGQVQFALGQANAVQPVPKLLWVMLRGGMDADSLLFQPDNTYYHDVRPTLSLGRNGLSDEAQRIDANWAVHPALEPLYPWLQRKQLAFVPFCGTGDNSRSHFKAQEVLERGLNDGERLQTQDGLLNRVVKVLARDFSGLGGANFVQGSPLMCAGSQDIPFVELRPQPTAKAQRMDDYMQALERMMQDPETRERLKIMSARQSGAREALRGQMDMDAQHGATARSQPAFVTQFEQMARLMRSGPAYAVGFAEINGWDTHQNQGNENGQLAGKFSAMAQALAAFAQGMGPEWARTQVVLMSEFGRTFAENGTRGTDHGHATTAILMSGRGFSQTVLGEQQVWSPQNLHEQRDQPVLNPYRDVLLRQVFMPMGLSRGDALAALKPV